MPEVRAELTPDPLDSALPSLAHLVQLVQEWAQNSGETTEVLAERVAKAQSRLVPRPRPPVEVSTSWLKRVRSGRLAPVSRTGEKRVDARYSALLLLVAESQFVNQAHTGGLAPGEPQAVALEVQSLVRRWTAQLEAHWAQRESPADSYVQVADLLGAGQAFDVPINREAARSTSLQRLGADLGRFLTQAAFSAEKRDSAMGRIRLDRADEVASPRGPQGEDTPDGLSRELSDRIIRGSLAALAHRFSDQGSATIEPNTAIHLVPLLERLVEVSCELRHDGDPSLYRWLSGVVTPR